MIISASKKTDIPAVYGDWFINRIREGFVDINKNEGRSNMPASMVRYPLSPSIVDAIVFWTRNAIPFVKYLEELDKLGYFYMFQYALTSYDRLMEPKLPDKNKLVSCFKEISSRIGPERIHWRYAPLIITEQMPVKAHIHMFRQYARILSGYTRKVIVSFDQSGISEQNMRYTGAKIISDDMRLELVKNIVEISHENGMDVRACTDNEAYLDVGVIQAPCIDGDEIARLLGAESNSFDSDKKRTGCCCANYVDIGHFHTCPLGCRYCCDTAGRIMTQQNIGLHQKKGSALVMEGTPKKLVLAREKTNVSHQMDLFAAMGG